MDPANPLRRRPNLIEGLMRYPSTVAQVPEENQFTEVLAWLIDRSDRFARGFVELFLPPNIIDGVNVIGARTQVGLPKATGEGMVWPDLSVAGDRRSFELLIEMKVAAALNEYESEAGREALLQPEYYIEAWKVLPSETQARVRRVGTLTNAVRTAASSDDEWRAPDVSWRQVRDVLSTLLDEELEASVVEVASDYVQAIDARILQISNLPPNAHVDALLSTGLPLLEQVAAELEGLAGASVHSQPKIWEGWVGMYLRLPSSGGAEPLLWIYVTPEGGKYNLFGQGDSLCVWAMEAKDERFHDRGRVLAGGFETKLDLAKYRWERLDFPLLTEEGEIADVDALSGDLARRIADALRTCDPPLTPS